MSPSLIKVYSLIVVVWLGFVGVCELLEGDLRIYVLDVGQGDSILMRTPGGKSMLVDGGGGDYVLVRLGEILPPWVRKIDVVVLTHPHADHFSGLLDVLDRYSVDEVWWNPVEYGAPEYYEFGQMILENGLRAVPVMEGSVEFERNIMVDVLWPRMWDVNLDCGSGDSDDGGGKSFCCNLGIACNARFGKNVNNDSVVLLVRYGRFAMLLTGDAEGDVEEELVDEGVFRDFSSSGYGIDVLKAGHHCSRTASGDELLDAIKPVLAICSCGEGNKFEHPHGEILEKFRERGIGWLRTDRDGTILVESDGDSWWVK